MTRDVIVMMLRYKAWADARVFRTVADLPEGEAYKERPTHFKTIAHTLNHVYVVDRIFQGHLTGKPHGYAGRNTETTPPLDELARDVAALDDWYIDYFNGLSDEALDEVVEFEFVDGGKGAMIRGEIALHLVNHTTYHRGFVGDMLNQCGIVPKGTDLTIFLRDVCGK